MSVRNTLYLMDTHPEIDEEIAIHIKSLMQDMKKSFDLDLKLVSPTKHPPKILPKLAKVLGRISVCSLSQWIFQFF